MRCPNCGSTNVRDSYVKNCMNFAGQLATHVALLPGHALGGILKNNAVGRYIGNVAEYAGGKVAEALYNKAKCEDCGHSWFYEIGSSVEDD